MASARKYPPRRRCVAGRRAGSGRKVPRQFAQSTCPASGRSGRRGSSPRSRRSSRRRARGILLPRARALTRGDRRGARRARSPATRGAGSTSRRGWPSSSRRTIPRPRASASPRCPRSSPLLDADTRHHGGRHPDRARGRAADALGTALVRATGPAEHVAALGPLPAAADEASLYAQLGLAVPPPEIRDGTLERRAAAAGGAGRPARRPPRAHDLVGRPGDGARDGHRRSRPRLRVPGDLRPHAERERRPGPGRRRAAPAGRGDRRRQRAARAVPDPARRRVRHPRRRQPRRSRRRPGRARLGPALAARGPARAARAS